MGNYEYEPIKKLKENNKKKMFFMFLTVFMFLGISFATLYFVYRYNDERENRVVSGLVDVDFVEKSQNINLENTVPMTDAMGKENPAYVFTVENTSKIPINLKIGIEIGTNTIDLSAIKYALYINNEEVKVDNLENLDSENNLYIKEQFASGAKIEVKLVFWIDYYYEKSGGSFSGTIKVEGEQYDIIYEETGAETIKKQLVSYSKSSLEDFTGGLVAINIDGNLYNEAEPSQKIREYRYSGPKVNNYVTFNDEAWRIVGIFKDDSGAEHLKIVRNERLTADMFPENYTISGTTYNIKYTDNDYVAYWNKKVNGTDNNDWATAGLQYWLNTEKDETEGEANKGYLSYLKGDTLSMIEDTKYYLGTITYKSESSVYGIWDTPKEAYVNERGVSGCEGGIGPSTNKGTYLDFSETPNCRVWANNSATWIGKIGLMYPSDYGFSTESSNWENQLKDFDTIKSSSWMNSMPSEGSWLLSPSSHNSYDIACWYWTGSVYGGDVTSNTGVRPSLYLNSNVKINGGIGTQDSPYTLTME